MAATVTARRPTPKANRRTDPAAAGGGRGASRAAGGHGAGGAGGDRGAGAGRLSGQHKRLLGVVAAIIAVAVSFVVGLNIGRPDWPAEGSADVGFARDMSSHHAQAVEMAMIAYQRATNDEVRAVGADIAITQQGQIGIMQAWLDTWRVPTNSSEPPMAWVPGGEAMLKGNLMPGMATREEINKLREATGEQVDILFLQYMLRHHAGGIHMVDAVLAADPSPPVRELAEAMKRGQQKEIVLMQQLLSEFGASPLPN